MVIGNGMIANRFISYKDDKSKIIFASGVSNSKDTIKQNFLREFQLLQHTVKDHPGKTLVYFSTCSIEDKDLQASNYIIHKKKYRKIYKRKYRELLLIQDF